MASLYVRDHQGKSQYLTRRLIEHGHTLTDLDSCDIYLTDTEWPGQPSVEIKRAKAHGAVVVNYGHCFPLQAKCNPRVDYQLAPTRAYAHWFHGQGRAAIVAGWPYSEQRPFRGRMDGPVVFAPVHHDYGVLEDENARFNEAALAFLPADVVVSIGEDNTARSIAESMAVIDTARLVVAAGTFAHLAVARGCPTVFAGSNYPPLFLYPLTLPCDLTAAYKQTSWLDAWRGITIGGDFDPACLDGLCG